MGGAPACALGVRLCGGSIHAELMGGPWAGGGYEGTLAFPPQAVRAVGAAADGVRALHTLVHAGLGRLLLGRLRERAEACGLRCTVEAMGTRLWVTTEAAADADASADAGADAGADASPAYPTPPWVRITLCTPPPPPPPPPSADYIVAAADDAGPSAASPVVTIASSKAPAEEKAVLNGVVVRAGRRGGGELTQLAALLVRELV